MDYRFNIALIYDFDGTLAPGNMQEYDFIPAVGKSSKEFWTESQHAGRGAGRRHGPDLHGAHASGGQIERTVDCGAKPFRSRAAA